MRLEQNSLVLAYATMDTTFPHPQNIQGWLDKASKPIHAYSWRNTTEDNRGVVKSYQKLYEKSSGDVICYLHDDLICKEDNWNERVEREFEDPEVALVGFGGAKWHGTPDLYKQQYILSNLRRGEYLSNVDDAEVHGQRFEGNTDVAVLDGFSLCCRRSFLDRIHAWQLAIDNNVDFLCYDYFICAMARRYNYRIRLAGLRCHHIGGGTSVGMNQDRQEEYDRSHFWLFNEFRDVLPYKTL